LQVVVLNRELDQAYQNFLLGHETSLIYHSPAYRDFLGDVAGGEPKYLLALDQQGEIRGALPLFFKKGPHGTVCNSLPFFGSIGGVVGACPQARSALLAQYNRLITGPNMATATIVENPLDRYDNDDIKRDMTDYRIGQITPLPASGDFEALLMSMYHQKTRNMVRKAEKSDFVIEADETAYDFLESVHRETLSALGGIAKSSSFFKFVQEHFAPGRMRRLYVARHQGELVAALLMLYFNKTAEYFVPVTRSDFRHLQPLSLIIYRAMIDAARDGFRIWNWGGTWQSQEGVYHFKKRWGTQDRRYTYYTRIRNRKLLKLTREEILRDYPWYFVLPFASLHSQPVI